MDRLPVLCVKVQEGGQSFDRVFFLSSYSSLLISPLAYRFLRTSRGDSLVSPDGPMPRGLAVLTTNQTTRAIKRIQKIHIIGMPQ